MMRPTPGSSPARGRQGRRAVGLAGLIGAWCLALQGCASLAGTEHPFKNAPAPGITDIVASPSVMVAPVGGPPPQVGRVMAELVADALRQRDVLAVTRDPAPGSMLLTGHAEMVPEAKNQALLRVTWSLTQADGLTAGTFQSEQTVPVLPGKDPYERLSASAMVPFANRAAFRTADLMLNPPKPVQVASNADMATPVAADDDPDPADRGADTRASSPSKTEKKKEKPVTAPHASASTEKAGKTEAKPTTEAGPAKKSDAAAKMAQADIVEEARQKTAEPAPATKPAEQPKPAEAVAPAASIMADIRKDEADLAPPPHDKKKADREEPTTPAAKPAEAKAEVERSPSIEAAAKPAESKAKPEQTSPAETAAKPEAKPEPAPPTAIAAKPAVKPEPASPNKIAAKPAAKPEQTSPTEIAAKPEAKPEPAPPTAIAAKPAVKPEPASPTEIAAKPAEQPAAKTVQTKAVAQTKATETPPAPMALTALQNASLAAAMSRGEKRKAERTASETQKEAGHAESKRGEVEHGGSEPASGSSPASGVRVASAAATTAAGAGLIGTAEALKTGGLKAGAPASAVAHPAVIRQSAPEPREPAAQAKPDESEAAATAAEAKASEAARKPETTAHAAESKASKAAQEPETAVPAPKPMPEPVGKPTPEPVPESASPPPPAAPQHSETGPSAHQNAVAPETHTAETKAAAPAPAPTQVASRQTAAPTPAPAAPPIAITGLIVAPIQGAPGNGNEMLATAIKQALQGAGLQVSDYSRGPQTAVLHGKVTVTGKAGPTEDVRIEWTVYDSTGQFLGTVTQHNRLPRSLIEGRWDETANMAASGAVTGIKRLIARPIAGGAS